MGAWLALLCLCSAVRAEPAPRAIWTWEEESYAMLEQGPALESAIAFLQAHKIQTIYLYADAYQSRNLLISHPELYRKLIRRLRQSGMHAYALLGSAYLNTERYILPQRRADALAMVHRVMSYNAGSAPEERFEGINLDIEPHILDEWDQDKMTLLKHFLDMSAAIIEMKRKYDPHLAVGPAIPFWWDGIQIEWKGQRKAMSEHTQALYEYVALMDYRDHAEGGDGIVSHAADELAYARKIGRSVVIGVETTPNEIRKVSFNHLSAADMERELGIAEQRFSAQPAFGGFVVHHYRGYRKWLEQQGGRR